MSTAPPGAQPLFEPIEIAGMRISNRTVFPAMTTRLADAEGYVTEALVAYYRARVRGGTGLITVEMASPELAGKHRGCELGIFDDKFVPGLTRLVSALREERPDVRLSIQLGHAGSRARPALTGVPAVAPTSIPTVVFEVVAETVEPEEMSTERVGEAVASYVRAAGRAQLAGFDFVELHGAHGYLVSQFLTAFENRRTDRYGGSLENRARFPLEIVRGIKTEVPRLGVIFRIGAEDFFDGGMTPTDGSQVAAWAAEAGADAISVTAGHYRSLPNAERMIPPMRYPMGEFLPLAARVKQAVDIPVIAVGRLGDPSVASDALRSGSADLVALGRPLLADPDWVAKTSVGSPVRRCLSCNHCVNNMRAGSAISCVVNSETGRELAFDGLQARRGRTIVVIGAGPAGLSYASLVAAGNDVTVMERQDQPGGAFRYTGLAPRFNDVVSHPEAFASYIAELEKDCLAKGVVFRYGTDPLQAQPELARADLVVVASGATYRLGSGPLARWMLRSGLARSRAGARLFESERLRNLLYYRVRRPSGPCLVKQMDLVGPEVVVIGDALKAGKAREAITSAFEAALLVGGDRPTPSTRQST